MAGRRIALCFLFVGAHTLFLCVCVFAFLFMYRLTAARRVQAFDGENVRKPNKNECVSDGRRAAVRCDASHKMAAGGQSETVHCASRAGKREVNGLRQRCRSHITRLWMRR